MKQRTMTRFAHASIVMAVAVVITASCGSEDSNTAEAAGSPSVVSTEATVASAEVTTAPGMTGATSTADESLPAWQTMDITDVAGATFRLSDFVGRPVFVENFATWCPTCRKQLGETQRAAAQVGDDAVVIALSVETDLSAADVADYATSNGFDDIRFAVMSPELLAAMVDGFGNSSVNPPSTPHVVIDATGVAGDMTTGRISAVDLVAALDAAA